jgi:hypothetical protein
VKVAIVGSRDYPDARQVIRYVLDLPPNTIVVSGGARGVDHWAEETARMIDLERIIYRPRVRSYVSYATACKERNEKIVETADRVVAFWDGLSGGTADTISKAKDAEKKLLIIRPDEKYLK